MPNNATAPLVEVLSSNPPLTKTPSSPQVSGIAWCSALLASNRQTLNGFSATRVIALEPPAHKTPLRNAGPPTFSWKAQVQVGVLFDTDKSQTVMWP
jgi:hypothetical protein